MKKVRGSSAVLRSILALSSSKQTPGRNMISTYRAGRLMSGDREKPALPWEKPIPQQLKAVFVRRCSPSHIAEEAHRKFRKKNCEGKTITNPVSVDSGHELACPHTIGTALRPCHRHQRILGSFPLPT